MAELTIRPDEIRDALAEFVRAYQPDAASTEEIGTVAECGDGIARVEGLPSAMANELLGRVRQVLGSRPVAPGEARHHLQRRGSDLPAEHRLG